jgi:hypothetical protein
MGAKEQKFATGHSAGFVSRCGSGTYVSGIADSVFGQQFALSRVPELS